MSLHGLWAASGGVAERYDRVRPGHPDQLFRDLAALGAVGPGRRVLEVGCGTGQATVPLAERGCRVVAVEPVARLAEVARRELARFPDVAVVTAAFEEWSLPAEPFDLVLTTAFDRLDPAVRVLKPAAALAPDGLLATVDTHHVSGGTAAFAADARRCYQPWDPTGRLAPRPEPASAIPPDDAELVASGRFGPAIFRRYEWDAAYTAEGYRDLLLTRPDHRDLPPDTRDGLLGGLTELISTRYGGRVVQRYLTELRAAPVMIPA